VDIGILILDIAYVNAAEIGCIGDRMKIIIFDREINDHINKWLSGLLIYLRNKGHEVIESCLRKQQSLDNCDLFMCWNGQEKCHGPIIREVKERGIKILYIECAFFPQSKFYYVDKLGINATASIMNDDFSYISSEHIEKLNKFRHEYLGDRKWSSSGEYILCPLQLDHDTNVINNSPYNIQEFINHVDSTFPCEKVLYKSHPLMPHLRYNTKNEIIRNGNFLDLVQNAKLVYGINSTCLLESALMKVPTVAIGNCWLRQHKGNEEKLLAKIVDMQIPVSETNLDYWLKDLI